MMNKTFMEELDKSDVEFIDNIMIYLETDKKHEKYFRDVLDKLMQSQLYAKFKKYELWI